MDLPDGPDTSYLLIGYLLVAVVGALLGLGFGLWLCSGACR
jgi:hypothetical protein